MIPRNIFWRSFIRIYPHNSLLVELQWNKDLESQPTDLAWLQRWGWGLLQARCQWWFRWEWRDPASPCRRWFGIFWCRCSPSHCQPKRISISTKMLTVTQLFIINRFSDFNKSSSFLLDSYETLADWTFIMLNMKLYIEYWCYS